MSVLGRLRSETAIGFTMDLYRVFGVVNGQIFQTLMTSLIIVSLISVNENA